MLKTLNRSYFRYREQSWEEFEGIFVFLKPRRLFSSSALWSNLWYFIIMFTSILSKDQSSSGNVTQTLLTDMLTYLRPFHQEDLHLERVCLKGHCSYQDVLGMIQPVELAVWIVKTFKSFNNKIAWSFGLLMSQYSRGEILGGRGNWWQPTGQIRAPPPPPQ